MWTIAHRGASFEAPENTLAAIQKALDLDVDCIEIDVRLCKGGIPVVIHDDLLGRTTDFKRQETIETLPLDEIKSLDAGSWFSPRFAGERIPTLKEVLQLDFGKTRLMIELKEGAYPAKEIAQAVTGEAATNPAVLAIGSFSPNIMHELARIGGHWDLIGISENKEMLEFFRQKQFKRLAVWYPLIDPQLLANLHEEGTKVWTFTVDDLPKIQFLEAIGVDGVFTNNPRQLLR